MPLMPALHTAGARRYSGTFISPRSSDHICRPDQPPPGGTPEIQDRSDRTSRLMVSFCCSSPPGAEPRPGKPPARVRARRPVYRSCRIECVRFRVCLCATQHHRPSSATRPRVTAKCCRQSPRRLDYDSFAHTPRDHGLIRRWSIEVEHNDLALNLSFEDYLDVVADCLGQVSNQKWQSLRLNVLLTGDSPDKLIEGIRVWLAHVDNVP